MQLEEKQLIDALFRKLSQAAAQSGPRDVEAETLITQHVQRIPGAAYYMAQTIIIQRQALKQAEAQFAQLQQRAGGSGFLSRQPTQMPQQPMPQQSGSGCGFLAGAAQTALGVAGGVLLADAATNLFDGIFGGGYSATDLFEAYDAGAEDLLADDAIYEAGYEEALSGVGDDALSGGFFDDLDLDDGW